ERRRRTVTRTNVTECAHSSDMRSHQILIQVAPAPGFARLERPDHRVPGRREVPGGVPLRRGVAAADMPAGQAEPQVHPAGPLPQAVLAALPGAGLGLGAQFGGVLASPPPIMPARPAAPRPPDRGGSAAPPHPGPGTCSFSRSSSFPPLLISNWV